MNSFIIKSKADLRKHYRALRSGLNSDDCDKWSQAMARELLNRLRTLKFDGTLFLFAPMPGEPNLLKFLTTERLHIALPISEPDGKMSFFLWHPEDFLEKGGFNISEPPEDGVEVFPRPGDCVVVPALAIDPTGHRLGMGKGYYDRWLSEFQNNFIFIAGAVYPPCLLKEPLPNDDHDIPMDFSLSI